MDSELPKRIIDQQTIDQAESVRSTGDFAEALRLAKKAMQLDQAPLSEPEVAEIVKNRAQATLLATAARLAGESAKSIMKRTLLPWQMKDQADEWLRGPGTLYGSSSLRNAAGALTRDHHDRPYHYEREFARDIADLLATISLLYVGKNANNLIDSADSIWNLLIESLSPKDEDRDFFTLEKNWFLFKTGRQDHIDQDQVTKSLRAHYAIFGLNNPDRLKTVAVRAFAMAEGVDSKVTMDLAAAILEELGESSAVPAEYRKLTKERYRNLVFKVWGVFMGKSAGSLQLYANAWHLGHFQQQRFIHAKP